MGFFSGRSNKNDITITNHPISDPLVDALPRAAKKRFEKIAEAVQKRDVKYISEIEAFLLEHPHIPKLYNFLESLYAINGQYDKIKNLAKLVYEKCPDYLFGKISYARLCLSDGKIEEFEKIFQGNYDLKSLYPHRNEFHISEFLSLMDVLCVYWCYTKQFDFVEVSLMMLKHMSDNCDVLEVNEKILNTGSNIVDLLKIAETKTKRMYKKS